MKRVNISFLKDNYGLISLACLAGYSLIKIGSYIVDVVVENSRHNSIVRKARLELVEKRDARIAAFVDKYKNEISKEDILTITQLGVKELADSIKNKKLTSRKVTLCYALNAATVGKELNNIGDADFERALKEAEQADQVIANASDINDLPPLIGVPMTVKDHIPAKGYVDTMGYCSNYNRVAEKDCPLVEYLRKLGIVVLCKTNVPMGLLCMESENRVFGTSKNIWDFSRTTGGSSGGEGGMQSSFCSPIGIGTDIGGSVRCPASFNGVYGFKPTHNKFSNKDFILGTDEYSAWKCWVGTTGFLSRKYEDIILISQLLFGSFNDYTFDQRKFNNEQLNTQRKLKVAYGCNFEGFEVHSDIAAAIKATVEGLKGKTQTNELNYEVVEFDWNKVVELFYKGYSLIVNGDGIGGLYESLKGEKVTYHYKDYKPLLEASPLKISFIKTMLGIFTNEKRVVSLLNNVVIAKNTSEFWKLGKEFERLKDEFYSFAERNGIDAFILPILPFAAPKNGNVEMTNKCLFYSIIVNMLDMPSVAIPCGNVVNTDYQTQYKDKLANMIKCDVKDSQGMPISFQVAALPGKDEISLRVAKDCIGLNQVKHNNLSLDTTQSDNFWKLRNQK